MTADKLINFVNRKVARFREDVESWQADHELVNFCWVVEDAISEGNKAFRLILDLEADVQEQSLSQQADKHDGRAEQQCRQLLVDWLAVTSSAPRWVALLEGTFGRVEGADELQKNIREAEAMLKPAGALTDGMARLRDRAIEEHRAGQSELLVP